MKKRFALILSAALCLSGCSWMDGSYVSVTPHVVTPDSGSDDTIQISSYAQLRNAMTDLVDSGSTHGLFVLWDYSQERISTDLALVTSYIQTSYPIGAYAV